MCGGGDINGIPQEKAEGSAEFQSPAARSCYQAAANWVPHVMICEDPYIKRIGEAYGCGRCLPCRKRKRREWAHRIMLEAGQYEDNAFVTLTYSDELIQKECPNGTLVPKHAQDWLKRIRKAINPNRIRFYLVGEYGDTTERPHYHAALFNFPCCRYGGSQYSHVRSRCCYACDLVQSTWGMGHITIGTLEPNSAAYIAGYVTKKMSRADDERLDGRYPEFARMSLRPGIGADAMHEVASQFLEHYDHLPDVPTALRHGKTVKPLGRYLVRYLRRLSGRSENVPQEVIDEQKAKLHDLSEIARAISPRGHARETFKYLVREENAQKVLQIKGKSKIYKDGKKL